MKDLVQVKIVDNPKNCFVIRKKVFIEEQNVPAEMELDAFDDNAMHIEACYNNEVCACARLRELDGSFKVERVAVLKKYRSKGIAKKIMNFIEAYASERKVKAIFLNAQESVIGFYENLGYVGEGEKFIEAGIVHLKMKKTPNFGGLS